MFKSNKITAVLGATVLCFGLSAGEAQAVETYSCAYATGSLATLNSSTSIYSSASYNNTCGSYTSNQSSSVATSTAVLATAASQAAQLVGNRVANAISGTGGFNVASNGFTASTGASGGNHGNKFGAWVSGSYSDVEDDNADTRFEGEVYTIMGGVDYRVAPKVIVGVSVGYEDVDIDTEYNASVLTAEDGSLEGDGYTIAPYLGVELGPNAHADLTIGYSDLEYDTVRFDPLTGNRITGSTDADRYFVNAAVNGSHIFRNNWRLRGRLGVFYATEEKDAFTETDQVDATTVSQAENDTELGQVNLDARFGYLFEYVEPYALAGVDFDFTKDEASVGAGESQASFDDEDFGARFGAGLNLRLGPNVSGGFEAYTVEFRDDYEEYTFTGGLRVNF